jgi:hypothetical protein
MAISLTISDGTITVTLSGTSPVLGCTYFPLAPARNSGEWQNVTESVEVNLRGTEATIRATVNSIERLLEAADLRQQTGMGARVYANYAPVTETAYRSEILAGRVVWSTDPGLRRLSDTNPTVRVAVIWTRRYYWEGAEVELSISGNGQAAATGGRTLLNDPANGNWMEAAAAQVTGNLPAPVKLTLQNTTGSAQIYYRLFMNVNAYSDPGSLVHYLQAEAEVGGSPTVDATCSGGNKLAVNATNPVLTWVLPAADMARTRGRRARIIARFVTAGGPAYITPQIRDAAGTAILWTGDEVTIPQNATETFYADLGVVPLPPGGYGTAWGALTLALSFRGAALADLDVLQLTMLDSYRYVEMAATSVANNASIVHDGIEEISYVLSGAAWLPLASAFGGALMLQPGVINRIHVLHGLAAAGTDDAPIANAFSVRAYYRPRRATV